MIKGAQKRMIVVKTSDSPLFEEAYFVMRRDSREGGSDMVEEAARIIESCGGRKGRVSGKRLRSLLFPACAFLSGGALGAAIAWLAGM